MKLLVDGGSTKADWIAIDENGSTLFSVETLGLNPEIISKEEVIKRLHLSEEILNSKENVTDLFFYGAGCGTDRMKSYLQSVLKEFFINANVIVLEDTYAAVYATTNKNEKAIVCILGTGSNCSYFDGNILHQKVQSLGYICMDDCSGNRFGRHLIRGYYFNKMPNDLAILFEKEYNLDADVIKSNLYKEPNPNAYLATFAKFLIEHKETDFCKEIIAFEINEFIENYIKQFDDCKEVPVNFVGSIAFHLKEELQEALGKHSIKIGNIIKKPLDGLTNYHINM
jgi:N-acetylglucosamine kinase-like BadF-type ATPase